MASSMATSFSARVGTPARRQVRPETPNVYVYVNVRFRKIDTATTMCGSTAAMVMFFKVHPSLTATSGYMLTIRSKCQFIAVSAIEM